MQPLLLANPISITKAYSEQVFLLLIIMHHIVIGDLYSATFFFLLALQPIVGLYFAAL